MGHGPSFAQYYLHINSTFSSSPFIAVARLIHDMNQKQSERQIRELLARYIKGAGTEEEGALVEKWYERVKGERFVVRLLSPADEERLVTELWKALAEKEG